MYVLAELDSVGGFVLKSECDSWHEASSDDVLLDVSQATSPCRASPLVASPSSASSSASSANSYCCGSGGGSFLWDQQQQQQHLLHHWQQPASFDIWTSSSAAAAMHHHDPRSYHSSSLYPSPHHQHQVNVTSYLAHPLSTNVRVLCAAVNLQINFFTQCF